MNESLWSLLPLFCLVASIVLVVRQRRNKLVHIFDYQAGLLFRDGTACRVLPPGVYRSSSQRSPISVVDRRPYQFVIERLMFRDVSLASAVISVAGEIAVFDPELSVTATKKWTDDSLADIQVGLPRAAARLIVDVSPEGKENLAASITTELNCELKARGVEIRSLAITELWSRPITYALSAEAN